MNSLIGSYLAVRRAAGYRLVKPERFLRSYAKAAAAKRQSHVRTSTAIEWAAKASSVYQRYRRLTAVIHFAQYAKAEDPRHEIPPRMFMQPRRRPLPHIYTAKEVDSIIGEAARLTPSRSIKPRTYSTLFGLLASCGLRISEALALRLSDVRDGVLLIRDSKFGKSRFVPLHKTTTAALSRYLGYRAKIVSDDDHLLVLSTGRVPAYETVVATFLKIVRKLGIHPGPGLRGPRLHDFRHTFAVRALEAAPRGRRLCDREVVALSTYLGHAHVTDTYWYLQATPRLMAMIADDCELQWEGSR